MRKSDGFDFSGLYGAILADIAIDYPDDTKEWNRDKLHLHSILTQEGLRFVTIVLPAVGKHLDQCLANGVLHPILQPHHRGYRRGGTIPRLFRALYLRIFEDSGVLRPVPDPKAVRYLRQLLYVAKKVRLPCHESAIFTAIQDFWKVERSMRSPSRDWDSDSLPSHHCRLRLGDDIDVQGGVCQRVPSSSDESLCDAQLSLPGVVYPDVPKEHHSLKPILDKIQLVADFVTYGLGDFNATDYRSKHGPGAVSDLRGKGDKYSFPHWSDKLEGVFGMADFAYANYSIFLDSSVDGRVPSRHEPPSKLCVVPKTLKAPRLIASEPTSHQWCQQVIKDFLYSSVRHSVLGSCIDFRRQDLSQDAALRASQSGHMATVDLSEASDRISCWLIERLFRSREDLLQAFHAVRTRWIHNPVDKKVPRHIVLKKFSTMGSALTFPIQSIAFATIVIGVQHYQEGIPVSKRSIARIAKEVRVFGDDIVCRAEDVGVLTEVLSYLGLKVNASKTFWTGLFRESCGLDAYAGEEVSPTYVLEVSNETRPNVVQSLIDTSNNFHKEGYWRTAEWILSTLPDKLIKKLAVMPLDVGGLSLSSFCGRRMDHLKSRWNHTLQRKEYLYLTALSKVAVSRRDNPQSLLQFFTERPRADWFGILPHHQLGVLGRPRDQMATRWGPGEQSSSH